MTTTNKADLNTRNIVAEQESVTYVLENKYYSNLMNKEYTAKIKLVAYSDGKMKLLTDGLSKDFNFVYCDPDRVQAIASLMLAAAHIVLDSENN